MVYKTYEVKLTKDELYLLDSKCSEKVQELIDKVRRQNQHGFDLPLINEILDKSIENGEYKCTSKQIRYCPICGDSKTYVPFKSGPRKGEPNYKKPIYLFGYKFNQGRINMMYRGDCCSKCYKKYNINNNIINYILENDLKIDLLGNKKSRYIKDDMRKCYSCGKEIYESEMGRKPTWFGGGSYPAECPHCNAVGSFLQSHEVTRKFRMIRRKEKCGI